MGGGASVLRRARLYPLDPREGQRQAVIAELEAALQAVREDRGWRGAVVILTGEDRPPHMRAAGRLTDEARALHVLEKMSLGLLVGSARRRD